MFWSVISKSPFGGLMIGYPKNIDEFGMEFARASGCPGLIHRNHISGESVSINAKTDELFVSFYSGRSACFIVVPVECQRDGQIPTKKHTTCNGADRTGIHTKKELKPSSVS